MANEELYTALRNADKAGDTAAAQRIAGYIKSLPAEGAQKTPRQMLEDIQPSVPPTQRDSTLGEKAAGLPGAALSIASSVPAGIAGGVAGIATRLGGGSMRQAEDKASSVTGALTYEPATQGGRDVAGAVGDVMSSLPPILPSAPQVRGVGGAARATLSDAAATAKRAPMTLKEAMQGKSEMAGVGAAETEAATQRRARAEQLPVPIKLTKGQAERTFEQQRFERETAKDSNVGQPLRERFAEQNQKILQNFDAWVDQTGSSSPNLRATGQGVTQALVNKSKAAKQRIREAYNKADQAGETAMHVSTDPLHKYIDDHVPEAINAPVLHSVKAKIEQLEGGTPGSMSIRDLEEIRKMINRVSDSTPTNAHFGGEVKSLIDSMTKDKGGDLYKQARSFRERYAKEFENQGVINKLITTKSGSSDRRVAYEDVFQHAILSGSLDDLRSVRRSLQTAGPEGKQAWRELQGETVRHLKDVATKNVQRDINGNSIISPAALDKMVKDLDKDSKLDYVFGKQGAQQIRDINDLAKDVYTSPPGSVNTSNTSSALISALDAAFGALTGLPAPAATALNEIKKRVKTAKVRKKVDESLK